MSKLRKQLRKLLKDERGISEAATTIILVVAAVIFVTFAIAYAGNFIPHGSTPSASLVVRDDPCNVSVGPYSFDVICQTHTAGPPLLLKDLRCVVLNSTGYVVYNNIIGDDPSHFRFPDDIHTTNAKWPDKILAPGETLYAVNTTANMNKNPGIYTIEIIWVPTHTTLVKSKVDIQ